MFANDVVLAVAACPSGGGSGTSLFAGSMHGGVYTYINSDKEWSAVNNGLLNTSVYSLAVSSSGTNLYAGTFAGVYRSTDNGASWTLIGCPASSVRALAVSPGGSGSATTLYAGTYGGGVFLSTDFGTTWVGASGPGLTSPYILSLAVFANGSGGTGILAGTEGGLFRSTDNGASWSMRLSIITPAVVTMDTNVFAGTSDGVYLSTNSGADWFGGSKVGLTEPVIEAVAVLVDGGGTKIFAGSYETGVFVSTDNGLSWKSSNNGLTNSHIYSLAISGSVMFAGTWGEAFRSTDGGSTWSWSSRLLPYAGVPSLAFSDTSVFAGTGQGVFVSLINGKSWTAANAGLNASIPALVVAPAGAGYGASLFAATNGTGVWRRPLSEFVVDVREQNQAPSAFALQQNYPNPFNPSTTIRYELPRASSVSLKVFNTLGQEVAVLVNERRDAGSYKLTWNANVPSGIYFYRLQAGEYVETKRMVLLR